MMIDTCNTKDLERIYFIINEASRTYKGVIPDDCYHEPYMPMEELLEEFNSMTFYGFWENKKLVGVMGFQPIKDVTLIRHSYILPGFQRRGIGSRLLGLLKTRTKTKTLLVGTWADAHWAVRFYEKNGFRLMKNKDALLRKYWSIPERQIETSVVLGLSLG